MTGNIQSKITYMAENAQGLCNALYELALCDENISTECLNSKIYEKKASAYELLRTHNTCASLICVLSERKSLMNNEKPPCISTPCIKCRYYRRGKCWLIRYPAAKGGEKRNGRKT